MIPQKCLYGLNLQPYPDILCKSNNYAIVVYIDLAFGENFHFITLYVND